MTELFGVLHVPQLYKSNRFAMLTMFATVIPAGPAIANNAYAECLIVPSSYPRLMAFLEKSSSIFKTVSGSNVFGSVEIGFLFANFCSNSDSAGFSSVLFPFASPALFFSSPLAPAEPDALFLSFCSSFPPKLELLSSSSSEDELDPPLFVPAGVSFAADGERGIFESKASSSSFAAKSSFAFSSRSFFPVVVVVVIFPPHDDVVVVAVAILRVECLAELLPPPWTAILSSSSSSSTFWILF